MVNCSCLHQSGWLHSTNCKQNTALSRPTLRTATAIRENKCHASPSPAARYLIPFEKHLFGERIFRQCGQRFAVHISIRFLEADRMGLKQGSGAALRGGRGRHTRRD
ncbi:hypothetical protein MTP99_009928 [Tenebrio molitor]|nr:hypothetical protein MTP99_009928 [Tenebrio molitor]